MTNYGQAGRKKVLFMKPRFRNNQIIITKAHFFLTESTSIAHFREKLSAFSISCEITEISSLSMIPRRRKTNFIL